MNEGNGDGLVELADGGKVAGQKTLRLSHWYSIQQL